jgi:hypothetical protein
MLRLPLTRDGSAEIFIFGKDITVFTKPQYISDPNSSFPQYRTAVYVDDGRHGNGGWCIPLPLETVVQLVKDHVEGV